MSISKTLQRCFSISVLLVGFVTELFAFDEPRWEIIGTLEGGRHCHRAAYIGTEKTIVFGGYLNSGGIYSGNATNLTEIIEVGSNRIYAGPPMNEPRAEFPYVVDSVGNLYVISGVVTRTVEKFDLAQQKWIMLGELIVTRRQHSACFISPTEILVVAGYGARSAEIFNIVNGTSRLIADYPTRANGLQAIEVDNGDIFFWGAREGGADSEQFPIGYSYNVEENKWEEYADFGQGASAPRSVKLRNGSVMICGGETSQSPFTGDKKVNLINQNGMVTKLAPMAVGRQHQELVEWKDNQGLVFGGIGNNVKYLTSCEIIHSDGSPAEPGPELNQSRAFGASVAFTTNNNEKVVLAISGLNGNRNNNTVEILRSQRCADGGTTDMLSSDQGLILTGSARQVNKIIDLTSTQQYQAGAVWRTALVDVQEGFETNFTFRCTSGSDNAQADGGSPGADGIAFIFQNKAVAPLGTAGEGIGYNEMPRGVAVEFDSYFNAAYLDPSGSHIAVQVGDETKLYADHTTKNNRGIVWDNIPELVADGRIYHARIVLKKQTVGYELQVYFDTTTALSTPVLVTQMPTFLSDVNANVYGQTRIGFTSATGKSSQTHELLSWYVTGCTNISSINDADDNSVVPEISVQPMPVHEHCSVQLGSVNNSNVHTLTVHDMLGKQIVSYTVQPGQSVVNIPTLDWTSGTYVINLISVNKVSTRTIQVLH